VPTFHVWARCRRDFLALSPEQQQLFRTALAHFVEDLGAGSFRPGLRVKGVRGAPGVFEMTWAADGRATFHFGTAIQEGQPHVVWRRCGTHDVLREP